jgi:23S rRNA pseudouridine2605 synthase
MASPKAKKAVAKKSVTKKSVTKKSIAKKPAAKKPVKSKKAALLNQESIEPELAIIPAVELPKIEDPIGDETDGETAIAVEQPAKKFNPEGGVVPEGGGGFSPRIKPKKSAGGIAPEEISSDAHHAISATEPETDDAEPTSASRPPAKLERLQKILAAAGVASRRSAEGMIEQGRVQVNGKVVTVLGTKADAARDHIRVDGKLLQGPERHRYFVLNKPRGFVTTVKDPEGRPTVMQFFDKMKERLYPVGRLDYMSEGLLVVTNDGELANRLTKASSGVEKTYLVKVAGQPTEAELNILRAGVAIERGKPGSPPVRTSPARIRQVRQGDNPWYEVVLIEGRNRELRKMFEEVGHFVEKIRRVGYGPLVLDQEPGSLRELQPVEVAALRQAAEGTLRTPKSKDLRRRNLLDAGLLPTVLPKPSGRPHTALPTSNRPAIDARPAFRPKIFGTDRPARPSRPAESFASGEANKLFRPARPAGSFDKNAAKPFRPARPSVEGRPFTAKPAWKKPERPARSTGEGFRTAGRSFDRPNARLADRPAWKKDDRPARPPSRFAAASTGESRPEVERPSNYQSRKFDTGRPFTAKPAWKKSERSARPDYKRPSAPRREAPVREARVFDEDLGPVRPPNLHIEEITGPDRPFSSGSGKPRSGGARPFAPRTYSDRPGTDRPRSSSSRFERPNSSSRPFTTSSGKPRPGGARPSSKPFKSGFSGSGPRASSDSRPSYGTKRPYGAKPASGSSRPYTPRTEGASDFRPSKAKPYPNSASRAERKAGPAWKPKTRYGPGKPASNLRSKPRPGSSAKPSHRVKPGGKKRS